MIARRALLAALLAGAAARGRAAAPIAVGAIRWDAWQADAEPTRAVERSLFPPQYRHRLPFFAEATPDAVTIRGNSQAVMDAEIALALRSGLGFWAFVAYPPASPMANGLRLYLASTPRRGLRFCLVSELVQWSEPAALDWQVELLRHPDHQRSADGRPLYFLGFLSERLIAERWGGISGLRQAVERFRARAVATGAGDPCLVLMARPGVGPGLAHALGADAISAYAISEPRAAAPFAMLAEDAERRWVADAASGIAVVPTIMTGWDRRPRIETPVPWERWQRPGAGLTHYYAPPTPAELAAHLRRGLAWIEANPRAAPARIALVYAWNENDEGGWLVPTLPFDDSRIAALRALLCAPESLASGPGCR